MFTNYVDKKEGCYCCSYFDALGSDERSRAHEYQDHNSVF